MRGTPLVFSIINVTQTNDDITDGHSIYIVKELKSKLTIWSCVPTYNNK